MILWNKRAISFWPYQAAVDKFSSSSNTWYFQSDVFYIKILVIYWKKQSCLEIRNIVLNKSFLLLYSKCWRASKITIVISWAVLYVHLSIFELLICLFTLKTKSEICIRYESFSLSCRVIAQKEEVQETQHRSSNRRKNAHLWLLTWSAELQEHSLKLVVLFYLNWPLYCIDFILV